MVKKTLWFGANYIYVVSSKRHQCWLFRVVHLKWTPGLLEYVSIWHVDPDPSYVYPLLLFYFLSYQKTTVIYPAARGLFHLNINRVCLEALAEMTDAVIFLEGTVSAKYIGCFFVQVCKWTEFYFSVSSHLFSPAGWQ